MDLYYAELIANSEKGRWCKVVCNGWKYREQDSWIYLDSDQYLIGTFIKDGFYVVLKNGNLMIRA